MIAVYVGDVLILGKEEDIRESRTEFKKTYKITELGKLRRIT